MRKVRITDSDYGEYVGEIGVVEEEGSTDSILYVIMADGELLMPYSYENKNKTPQCELVSDESTPLPIFN